MPRHAISRGLQGQQLVGHEDTAHAVVIMRPVVVSSQGVPDAVEGGALGVEPYEGVDVHGHADRAVAEDFHDHASVGALFVEQRGAGVA